MSSALLSSDETSPGEEAGLRTPPALLVAGAVAAAVLGTWLGSGVAPSAVLRFVAFEALYVVLPGCLLYVLLSPAPGGRLRTLAIGWPLGYAMEVGAFASTAALHARGALTLLPLGSLALGGLLLARPAGRERLRGLLASGRPPRASPERTIDRAGAPVSEPPPGAPSWRRPELLVALGVTAAVLVLAFTYFASYPLPEHARSVSYNEDNVFDMALAAEARRHWPITEAWVAGEPLHYYTGIFMHAAALNQVLGTPYATAFLRLLPSTMFLIAALQLWALGAAVAGGSAGRSRGADGSRLVEGSRRVGPLAVALLLMARDVNLSPLKSSVLTIDPFTQFPYSPTFAFGVVFFLGALLLVQTRVVQPPAVPPPPRSGGAPPPSREVLSHVRDGAARRVPRRDTAGLLAMAGALTAGLGAAKAFGAFDFVGGLGVYWLWQTIRSRGTRTLTYCTAAAAIAVLAIYFLLIAGGGEATMGFRPLKFLQEANTLEQATHLAKRVAGPSLYWLVLAAGGGALAVLALAPLLGAGWLLWRRRGVSEELLLLLCVFAVGMLGYTMLGAPGGVEGVFFVYGYIALVPVAALGLARLWDETPAQVRRGLLRAGGALVALGVAFATVTASVRLTGRAGDALRASAYAAVAAGAAVAVRRLAPLYAPALPSRPARVVACAILLLSALALVKPLTLTGNGAWKTLTGKAISAGDAPAEYGMTAALYEGLGWVRAHTTPCDVLAVSNVYDNAARTESAYFYYSAFAERRTYLESWHYTAGGQTGAQPYPARFALNQSATRQGDPGALRELARRGVKYVLIDRTHGGGAAEPASVSTLVYSSPALDVYRLHAVAGGPRRCAAVS